jgi:glucose-1-phosphate cytidylyltransferase
VSETKVAILAGGAGTRLAEETDLRPKPLVEVGGWPILWHILKHYAHYGFTHFVIALGYRSECIKRYMIDSCLLGGDLSLRLKSGDVHSLADSAPDWTVKLIDTGLETLTGGRLKRLRRHLADGSFMLTWGEGLSDLSLGELLRFHRAHGRLATLTAVRPPPRFGHMCLEGDRVTEFMEKPEGAEGWISGGFFVCEPSVFDYIEGDATQWEREPLENLARDGELMAYRHNGFWQCMDTIHDKRTLQRLWDAGEPPWVVWE